MESTASDAHVFALERPHQNLLANYVIRSFTLGPLFPFLLVPLFFRYRTLRYRFDEEGVSMRWGVLFRREINLTYARIQDIHLTSNVVERWLELARVEIQTASGSAKAEMVIEGLTEFEAVRDFLYARMRGMRSDSGRGLAVSGGPSADPAGLGVQLDAETAQRLAGALARVADELEALRAASGKRGAADPAAARSWKPGEESDV